MALARWIKEFWIESAWRLRSTRRHRYHSLVLCLDQNCKDQNSMICSSSQHTRFMFWFSVFGLTNLGLHEQILYQNKFTWFNVYQICSISKQLFRQTQFDSLFHVFYVLVFLTKHILELKDKNYDMYMFHVYWISIHMHHVSKCLNIMFLYLDEFLDKMYFLFKNPSFRKYKVW